MQIELLWLIPIIAVAVFVFFVVLYLQRTTELRSKARDLSGEVEIFNAGKSQQKSVAPKSADDRLREMEKMINSVAEVVTGHGRPSEDVRREGANEVKELREKLRSMFREYDIVLSENYTLRAKVKQLSKQIQELEAGAPPATGVKPVVDSILTASQAASKPALHLYDDTRFFNIVNQDGDDLSESDDTVER
jgi:archaellum component FlaC